MTYVYEPEYANTGWFDDGGYRQLSWFDRELTDDALIKLVVFDVGFFDDDDLIYQPPPITVVLTAGFFDDDDLIFTPMSLRALVAADKMLKNEVRRVR